MNNFLNSLKRLVKNKNTVTIVGVVVVLALLYWGYSTSVNNAVKPVTIPVASQTIKSRTQITSDMVTTIRVSNIAVSENVYRRANDVIGKFTNVNTIVPEGSMFYYEAVVDNSDFKDAIFENLKKGEIPYLFKVDIEKSYGNSIYPGNLIDIYMKAIDDSGKVVVGKLLEDVEVLAVRDQQGNDVFADTSSTPAPSYFVVAVKEQFHILLRKANYITTNAIDLFPVPHGGTYIIDETTEVKVSTEYLKEFINSKSVILEGQDGTTEEEVKEDTTTDTTADTKTKKTN